MTQRKSQIGVGMVEVLVALIVLAIGVLGFVALQLRAVDATQEAHIKIQAMNIARDLGERIRSNRTAYVQYVSNLNASEQKTQASIQCFGSTSCSATQMAHYDTAAIVSLANTQGMKIAMPNCQVEQENNDDNTGRVDIQARQCVYISWGETKPLNSSTDENACTNGGAYLPAAKCIVMELY